MIHKKSSVSLNSWYLFQFLTWTKSHFVFSMSPPDASFVSFQHCDKILEEINIKEKEWCGLTVSEASACSPLPTLPWSWDKAEHGGGRTVEARCFQQLEKKTCKEPSSKRSLEKHTADYWLSPDGPYFLVVYSALLIQSTLNTASLGEAFNILRLWKIYQIQTVMSQTCLNS